MIHHVSKEGPESLGGVQIWLNDLHGEYPLPDPETIKKFEHPNGMFRLRVQPMFTTFYVSELLEHGLERTKDNWEEIQDRSEKILKDLMSNFPEPFRDRTDVGTIVEVSGALSQHTDLFDKYCIVLAEGCTGSDDDFYDYWPGAMDMAYDYATDLDKVSESKRFTRRLKQAYKAVKKRRPEIAEEGDPNWEWPK